MKSSIRNTLQKIDLFGERPEFSVNGKSTFPTWNGVIVSLAILNVTLWYGNDKLDLMISYGDTSFSEFVEPHA